MKFWKILRKLLDEIFPDWQDKFISYKDLKQQLKSISPSGNAVDDDDERSAKRPRLGDDGIDEGKEAVAKEMKDFVMLLEGEIKKFNGFFMDKEEEYIIRLKLLKDEVASAKDSKEERMKVGRELVDFHGESDGVDVASSSSTLQHVSSNPFAALASDMNPDSVDLDSHEQDSDDMDIIPPKSSSHGDRRAESKRGLENVR